MQIIIPTELCQYVRMSPKEGLIHSPDMPKELLPLFKKNKTGCNYATATAYGGAARTVSRGGDELNCVRN